MRHQALLVVVLAALGLIGGCILPQGVSAGDSPLVSLSATAAVASDTQQSVEGVPSCRGNWDDAAAPALPAVSQRDNVQQLPSALRAKALGAGPACSDSWADAGRAGASHALPAPHLTTVLRI